MLVISQKMTSWITLAESTTPTIAPANASSREKNRGTGSAGDM